MEGIQLGETTSSMWRNNTTLIDDYCLQLGSLLDRRHTERVLTAARHNAEQTAQLAEEAMAQAQAADRAKTNFLANVTHELRTPLNAIIGFSEIIGSGTAAGDHAAYGKYIHEAGTRLLGMINDVLTLARIEAGKVELDEQVATIGEVIGASIRAVAADATSKSVTIDDDGGTDVLVRLDPNRMKQVFVHLLSNAVKFNREDGSIRVSAALDKPDTLTVRVRDTGCGIPPDHLSRVFEPFSQVEDHLTRENEGVGLGLPLARAMARMHGGDLTLTSEVGVGTVAEVTLPAERLSPTPAG
ncbi:MAG TPA: HAMP domain-containing sensor histidine kinase [Stellaceae bacterium]|nr:HAMP domain-containing sensor histidine kinase [Stellaceae bacterium]